MSSAALWFLWVPGQVRARLQAEVAFRGLQSDLSDVEASFSGIVIEGMRLRGAVGNTLDVRIERVEVDANPILLAVQRSQAVRRVRVHGVQVDMNLADKHLPDALRALRARRAGLPTARAADAGGDRPKRRLPPIDAAGVEVNVLDADGPLLRLQGGDAQASQGTWSAQFGAVRLGTAPGEEIALSEVRLAGPAEPVALSRVEVAGGTFGWVAESATAPDAQDELPASRGRTLARVLRARRSLRPPTNPQSDSETNPQPGPGTSRIAPDLRVQLSGLGVTVPDPAGKPVDMLTGLDVLIEGAGKGTYRARGGGNEPSGGTLSWDLHVTPSAARMEGTVALDELPLQLVAPALPPAPWHQLSESRLSGKLELRGTGLERVAARGQLQVQDVALASPGLAHRPVGPVTVSLDGDGTWIPAKRRLEIKTSSIEIGSAKAQLQGALEYAQDHYLVDVRAQLPQSGCREVLSAVPRGLLAELSEVELDGTFQAALDVFVDSRALDDTKVDFTIRDRCRFRRVPELLDASRFGRAFLHRALEPDGTIFEMETGPGTPAWTAIEHISPFMIQAVVAHEDGSFFGHKGFAEAQIGVALARNLKAGAYRFGASTISMQLVKNVFLQREKLLSRKVQEAFITWWMEQQWSKRQILELYLNVIEYGPSVYGIRNAAWHYFGLSPMHLTPAQAGFLATVLPNPKLFTANIEDGVLPERLRKRIGRFLKHMHARERIDDAAYAYAQQELATFKLHQPGDPAAVVPQVTGSAKPPPFSMERKFDAWEIPEGIDLSVDLP